ncbi:MAG: NUDIX domain-containing protein [Planctomycetota bacterium]|nr:NUDIX domain-containing protein [Planctomycetota bacterium]
MNIEPGNRVRAAGILLIHRDAGKQSFLLMRHHERWDLPKGHCEAGESFRETALRETEEETGITAKQIRLDPDFSFELFYPVQYGHLREAIFQKQVRYFLGYLREKPDLKITEHESASWFLWSPPHQIQSQTIDPLLAAVAEHLSAIS